MAARSEPSAVSLQLLSPWLVEGLSLRLQSLEVEHLAGSLRPKPKLAATAIGTTLSSAGKASVLFLLLL